MWQPTLIETDSSSAVSSETSSRVLSGFTTSFFGNWIVLGMRISGCAFDTADRLGKSWNFGLGGFVSWNSGAPWHSGITAIVSADADADAIAVVALSTGDAGD